MRTGRPWRRGLLAPSEQGLQGSPAPPGEAPPLSAASGPEGFVLVTPVIQQTLPVST